ncbi:hypothetical protein LTS18_007324 [Coniosporium uncinatum]|uniref:Uncharacterized protein n=1 Tax=Coniosporium uncinatum TaxID=93489 RepID=A0ACC3D2U6_9PEZI|nr:hypothetical protein LTS18_007324 [Coniosporium uncinatum]
MTVIGPDVYSSNSLHPAVGDGIANGNNGKPNQAPTNGHTPHTNGDALTHNDSNDSTQPRDKTITLRRPGQPLSSFTPPSPQWLAGKWNITHSSLPTWRDKKNVAITYTLADARGLKLDDSVEFQFSENGKVRNVAGTQTMHNPNDYEHDGTWDWHGKGLIKLAKAHWECLGWGRDEETGVEWMVTFFVKTAFTPDGINVYARAPERLPEKLLARIEEALMKTRDKMLGKLAAEMVATGH